MSLDVAMIIRLVDKASAPLKRLGANARAAVNVAAKADYAGRADRIEAGNRALAGQALAVGGAVYAMRQAIRPAIAMEEALAEVNKVAGFESKEALSDFEGQLVSMSSRLPVAATELAGIAADAATAGVSLSELLPWTEMTARNAVALGMDNARAGFEFSRLRSGMRLTLDETMALADATNHLSNNMASAAPDIVEVLRRVGGAAQQFNLSETEVAAFASAMLATGQAPEVVATSIANMGRALTRGESATKRQSNAFQKLGLDAADVAAAIQRDAIGTIEDVLARIDAMPKEVQAAISSDLFGDEARALTPLIANGELLADALAAVAEPATYAGSALAEYNVRAATTANNAELFVNKVTSLQLALAALLPAVNELLDAVGPFVDQLAAWARENPEVISAAAELLAGILALKAASLALRFLFGGIVAKGLRLIGAFRDAGAAARTLAKVAIPVLIGAVKALGRAVLANPLGAILTLGAVALTIYENWEPISAFFERLWGRVTAAFNSAWEAIKPIVDRVTGAISTITDALPSFWGDDDAPDAPAAPTGSRDRRRRRRAVVDGARASGGPVRAGGLYLVGEDGPELFRAPSAGGIVPARATARMLRASGLGLGGAALATALAAAPLEGGPRVESLDPRTGAAAPRAIQVGEIHIHAAPGADAHAIAEAVMRRLREEAGGDGDLHDGAHYGGGR